MLALLIGGRRPARHDGPRSRSWAASLGLLTLDGSWLAFLGYRFTPWILTLLAVGELVTDQLPSTPSRKVPIQFAARIIMGGLQARRSAPRAALSWRGSWPEPWGRFWARWEARPPARLAGVFGRDRPAALLEDALAILGAALIVGLLP